MSGQNNPVGPAAMRGGAAPRPERKTLLALRRRAIGGSSFMACRHPDIDHMSRQPTAEIRQCVIDLGNPESCEMSAKGAGVTDKRTCDFWKRLPRSEPAGCSAEETLMLVGALLSDGPLEGHDDAQPPQRSEPQSPSPRRGIAGT